jgi:hypothetical protein
LEGLDHTSLVIRDSKDKEYVEKENLAMAKVDVD